MFDRKNTPNPAFINARTAYNLYGVPRAFLREKWEAGYIKAREVESVTGRIMRLYSHADILAVLEG